jgi:hypothetical protein
MSMYLERYMIQRQGHEHVLRNRSRVQSQGYVHGPERDEQYRDRGMNMSLGTNGRYR